jgi:DNA repair exonuclease SbcCD ATPase subunit
VTVTLSNSAGDLEVRRTVRAQSSRVTSHFNAALGGKELPENEFNRLLSESWSADPTFVSRTAFLTEGLRAEPDEPDLRSHLCQIYSLDELQRAVAEIRPSISRANREVREARAELSATEEELNSVKAQQAVLKSRLGAAQEQVSAARGHLAHARLTAEQHLAAQRQQAAALAWDQQSDNLYREIESVAGSVDEKAAAREILHRTGLRVREDVNAIKAEQARLDARLEAVAEGLASLRATDGQCPVCLRDLDDESRERAEHRHSQDLAEIRERLRTLNPDPLLDRLGRVEALESQMAALGARPTAETPSAPEMDVRSAEADLEQAIGRSAEIEVAVRSANQAAERIASDLAEAEQLKRRYRQVALLEAADKALNSTISSVLGEQLVPLSLEVNRRWQAVFPDRPNLKVLPDGTMSRDVGGSPLAFAAFSAGEKMVARLMMRITTLLATTRVPFCWVDEPLEHLDPRNRHLVGSMLAHLGSGPDLEQIFVTTYEEPLARRLAESQPNRVRVEYLRTEQVS